MIKTNKKLEAIKDTLSSPENLGTHFYILESIKGFNFSVKFDKINGSIEYFTKSKPINFKSNKSSKIKVLNDTINGVSLISKLVELINIKYPEDAHIEFFLTLFSVGASESKYTEYAIIMYDILVGSKQLESKYEDFDNVLDYCTLAGIKTNPIIKIANDLDSALSISVNSDSMIPYLFNNSSKLVPMYGITIRPYKELQYKLRSKTHRLIIELDESNTSADSKTEDSEFLKFLNIESLNVVKAQNPKNLETELIYYIIEKINEIKHLSVEEIKNLKSKYLQRVKDFISAN
ncbi:hypothetical phage protein [Campylobacter phage CP220]|uniref:Hypothetical phage protein n=1 Tax=Campylobacter phage CP220 TaxID=2994044 RepID=D5GVF3_9CAUD|nr:hypothetical protein APL47_gp159 [Campylobacter phage CP220]CBJ93970.1 hypothetical phage protein [Campylobacter phage CP220]